MLRALFLSLLFLALQSHSVNAYPGFHTLLWDLHGHIARQVAADSGPSTILLADLAEKGVTTPVGRTIHDILRGNTTAIVDPSVTYTRPDAVIKAGLGGLDHPACGTDTCCIWSYIVPAMVDAFSENGGTRCSALARSAIRIGFHDAARSENRGLANIADLILSWHSEFSQYSPNPPSVADLIQVGAIVATVTCPGGPRIRAFVGRPNFPKKGPAPPEGLIPKPTADPKTIIAMMAAKTFTTTDLVALLGAHSVSRQFFTDLEFAGFPQDTTDGVFDTKFYAETDAPSAPVGVYRIASDVALAGDPMTSALWKNYSGSDAATQSRWTGAYASAYVRLSLLGVANLNGLTDCSGVLPQSKALP
ncbi:hypothetical protein Sste5346_003895 [Sporothrix stenoceras]|uniref:Peroxidase n=1 Tax=Sporothrix stenoceras TaxID=5173 RepID=A0ABR3ZDK8_9PEZI